ncbi:alpha/beta hydrolase, partial [bacterium]|nr:alpha/beta hydrolase [bacterium]
MNKKILGTILLTGLSVSLFAQSNQIVYSLDFNPKKYEKQNLEYDGGKIDVRAYETIVYVANPLDTAYEVMNIYIPEAYFNGKSI